MIEIDILLKATALAAFGLAATSCMGRAPASTRHLWLAATFGALALLPLAALTVPSVDVVVPADAGLLVLADGVEQQLELVGEVVVHDAVAELGVVGDLAEAGAGVAALTEGAQCGLGELVAPLVVLVGGRASRLLGGNHRSSSLLGWASLYGRNAEVLTIDQTFLDECPEKS